MSLRVNSVTLMGFKTYRAQHTAGPFAGFSVVVGANGLGKSTIVEGIVWCLGGAAALGGGGGGGRNGAAARAVVAHGCTRAEVTVHFAEHGERLSIRRTVELRGAARQPRARVALQRAGEAVWRELDGEALAALLLSLGLGGLAPPHDKPSSKATPLSPLSALPSRAPPLPPRPQSLPLYLAQAGGATRLLALPPDRLFATVEGALVPAAVRAAQQAHIDAACARAVASSAHVAFESRRDALDGAAALVNAARSNLAARARALRAQARTLRAAQTLHTDWHTALHAALDAAEAATAETGEAAARATAATGSAKALATSARAAVDALVRERDAAAAEARAAGARVARLQRARVAAELARATHAEQSERNSRKAAERSAALGALADSLARARAEREAAARVVCSLGATLRARLRRLGLAAAADAESAACDAEAEAAAAAAEAADLVDADADAIDRQLWTLAASAAGEATQPRAPPPRAPPTNAPSAELSVALGRADRAARALAAARAELQAASAARPPPFDADALSAAERTRAHAVAAVRSAQEALNTALSATGPARGAREALARELAETAARGERGGARVHGPLSAICWLAEPAAAAAISAALGATLRETLVVEARADGEAVCAAFRARRVGRAHCTLRAETEAADAAARGADRPPPPAGGRWLRDAIGCDEPRLRPAVDAAVGGWVLCADGATAERLARPARPQRGYDCVTLSGQVYLRSGEMRSAPAAAAVPASSLGAADRWALKPRDGGGAGYAGYFALALRSRAPEGNGDGARAAAAAADPEAIARDALERALADERASARALQNARADAAAADAAAAAADARERAATDACATAEARHAAALSVATAATALASATAEAAPTARAAAGSLLAHAAANALRSRWNECASGRAPAVDVRSRLEQARAQAAAAEAAIFQLGHKRKRAAALASDGAATPETVALPPASSAVDDAAAAAELDAATAERAAATARQRAHTKALRTAEARATDAAASAAAAQREREAARRASTAARAKAAALRDDAQRVTDVQAELASSQASLRAALATAGADAADDSADEADAEDAGAERGGRAKPHGAATLAHFAERSAALHDESEATAATLRALDAKADELRENPTLAGLPAAVEQLRREHTEWRARVAAAEALEIASAEAQSERIAAFETALAAANSSLSLVFAQLSPGGDASLQLDGDAQSGAVPTGAGAGADEPAAESEGAGGALRALARVRGQPWRPFGALSGGQQQLLALGAQFALGDHAEPRAPILLLDEIDSALDSRNVRRVAELLRARRAGAQAVVVSLRLQMIEQAAALTGVYALADGGGSETVTLHLDADPLEPPAETTTFEGSARADDDCMLPNGSESEVVPMLLM